MSEKSVINDLELLCKDKLGRKIRRVRGRLICNYDLHLDIVVCCYLTPNFLQLVYTSAYQDFIETCAKFDA